MTQAQVDDFQRFLALAAKDGCKVIGKGTVKATGQACYSVTSSKGKSAYVVTVAGSSLVCECKARGYCKHRALVRHTMMQASTVEASPVQAQPIMPAPVNTAPHLYRTLPERAREVM